MKAQVGSPQSCTDLRSQALPGEGLLLPRGCRTERPESKEALPRLSCRRMLSTKPMGSSSHLFCCLGSLRSLGIGFQVGVLKDAGKLGKDCWSPSLTLRLHAPPKSGLGSSVIAHKFLRRSIAFISWSCIQNPVPTQDGQACQAEIAEAVAGLRLCLR